MEHLALIAMTIGFTWAAAGVLTYPGVSWKPGAGISIAAVIWLSHHDAMPPEPLIEAGAIVIFIALSLVRERQVRGKRVGKAE